MIVFVEFNSSGCALKAINNTFREQIYFRKCLFLFEVKSIYRTQSDKNICLVQTIFLVTVLFKVKNLN